MDIRKLCNLKHFTVTQGACTDGKYIYMVFERKRKKNQTHRCKIVVYDPEKEKVVKVSGALMIGHGNDLCYRDGILYITHSDGKKVIHRVDAKTLKKKKNIKVKGYFNGIACYGSGFILRVMGGREMVITNKNFKITRRFKTNTNYKTSQGMTMDGKTILRGYSKLQSGENYLVEYSIKGVEKNRLKLKIAGELEGVFILNGKRYVTTYLRKNGKAEAHIHYLGA